MAHSKPSKPALTLVGISISVGIAAAFGLAFVWIYTQGLIWSSGQTATTVEFYANCPADVNLGWLNPRAGDGIEASIPSGRTSPVAVIPVTPPLDESSLEAIMDLNGNGRTDDLIEFIALNESGTLWGQRKTDTAEAPMPSGAPAYADAADLDGWEEDLHGWLTRTNYGIVVDVERGCWGVRGEG